MEKRPFLALNLSLLTFCGLSLRLCGVGHRVFYHDEILMWKEAVTGQLGPHIGPATPYLLRAFIAWTGATDDVSLHIFLAFIGSLVVPLSFYFGAAIDGRTLGWITAGLMCVSPLLLFWSAVIRPYPLFLVATGLLHLSFLNCLRTNTPRAWVYYSLCGIFCLLTHLVTFHILAGYFFYVCLSCLKKEKRLLRHSQLKYFLITTPLVAVIGAGWTFFRAGHETLSVLEGIAQINVFQFLRMVFVGLSAGNYYPTGSLTSHDFTGLIILLLAACGIFKMRRSGKGDVAALFLLVISSSLFTMYLTLGPKWTWQWYRYIAHLQLLYFVFLAFGLYAIWERLHLYQKPVLVVVLVYLIFPYWEAYYSRPQNTHYNFKADALGVSQIQKDLSGVLFEGIPNWETAVYAYYHSSSLPLYEISESKLHKFSPYWEEGFLLPIQRSTRVPFSELKNGRYALFLSSGPCDTFSKDFGISTRSPDYPNNPFICDVRFSETPALLSSN